jgi:hypothetical protein
MGTNEPRPADVSKALKREEWLEELASTIDAREAQAFWEYVRQRNDSLPGAKNKSDAHV